MFGFRVCGGLEGRGEGGGGGNFRRFSSLLMSLYGVSLYIVYISWMNKHFISCLLRLGGDEQILHIKKVMPVFNLFFSIST